ncbi:MAG: HAD family phosphatase [Salinivirgaceae bacterium]|nr:HAD family phosphatase [Salinivirgaceae bacterium]
MVKGVIFDFNGTMFLDSPLHEQAWIDMAKKLRTEPLGIEEFYANLQGRTNLQIITYLLGRQPSADELESITEEKELLYRTRCSAPDGLHSLAPGVENFLNQLKPTGIPFTIATGSYLPNVQFYFSHLHLEKWFDFEKVIYDDGTYPGKPSPDIFLKAADKIGVKTADCLVFEDSYAGIRSAVAAGIGRIVTVERSLDAEKVAQIGRVFAMRDGFVGLDTDILR